MSRLRGKPARRTGSRGYNEGQRCRVCPPCLAVRMTPVPTLGSPSSAKSEKNGLKLRRGTSLGQRKWFCWIHTPRLGSDQREAPRTPELVPVSNPPQDGPGSSVGSPRSRRQLARCELAEATQEGSQNYLSISNESPDTSGLPEPSLVLRVCQLYHLSNNQQINPVSSNFQRQ